MGILKFLFGKLPDIFVDDKTGQVRHKLPLKKWDSWKQRYKTGEYNWKKHSGTEPTNYEKS